MSLSALLGSDHAFGSLKALIVDDNTSVLLRLSEMLAPIEGLQCVTFSDPLEAFEGLQRTLYDIILVDYVMPGMDGLELIAHIRGMPEYALVPIVMISGEGDDEVRLKALELGASDFVAKTVKALEVQVRVRNLLSLYGANRKLNDRAAWLSSEVKLATKALLDREEEMIFRLSLAVEYRDNDTGGHTLRVAAYSQIIAEELGLPAAVCRSIFVASPLHDVGKVAIPDAVLLKPGKLDGAEFEVVRSHAGIGERILSGSNSDLIELAAEIAGAHHERWDGSGYPRGLAGRLIPLPARIVAVADVYDALTNKRPYKDAMSVDDAFAYMAQESGRHFCPTCIEAFLKARGRIVAFSAGPDAVPVEADQGANPAQDGQDAFATARAA